MIEKNKSISDLRETRIKRLIYRAKYTGMKETDLLLGQFADRHLSKLNDEEIGAFEAILETGDPAIYAWVKGEDNTPETPDGFILSLIKQYKVKN